MLGIPMFSMDGRLFCGKVLVFSLMVMVFSGTGHALPELSGLLATPSQAWTGENILLSVKCTDNESTIKQVYAYIEGPGISWTSPGFSEYENSTFMLSVSDFYGKTGVFNVAVYCTSENNTANQNTTFSVSEFSGEISSVSPDSIYVGDTVEVDMSVKKDDVYLSGSSAVTFEVLLAGESVPLTAAYDFEKGWRIRFEAPSVSGTYDVNVAAFYEGAVFEAPISIEVKDVFEFSLTAVDKSEVLFGENITATIFASEQSSPISISKSSISAKIGSYAVDVADISLASNGKYVATITLPSLTPAAYDLKITFSHQNFTAERTSTITYLVSASGTLLDPNGGAVSAKLSFMSGALERYVYTDSKGAYRLNLPSRTYDVRLVHDRASIVQQGVSVSVFDDPLRFYYIADIVIPGIKPAGLFMFETTLSADDTEITLNYDERKVSSESGLVVYRCGNWNSADKKCFGSWDTISASIDPVRNSAKFSSANPSGAYTLGSLDALFLDFSIDKTTYYVGDVIKAVGISEKSGGNYVGNIEITGRINGQPTTKTVTSSENGVFALDLEVPSAEGSYTLVFTAELEPYQSFETTKTIEVIKRKEISLVLPDTVRISVGEISTIEVHVVNTGQTHLVDGKISISGIPDDYYSITPELLSVGAGDETKFFINFEIPESAPKTTHGADITIPFGEKTFKKTFALTIKEPVAEGPAVTEKEDADTESRFSLPTGLMTSAMASDIIYLMVFSVISFSAAIFLKNRRTPRTSELGDSGFGRKAYLFEIKKAVEKGFGAKLKKVVKRKRTVKKAVSKRLTKIVKRKHIIKKAVRKVARRKK